MDSCSPAATDGTKSHRAIHSSAKPFPLLHAAASSKPRKPSSSLSKPSTRFHLPSSKIPAPPGRTSEKKSDAVLILQGPPSPKSGEKSVVRDGVLRKEKVVVKDEGSKDEKALVTDQALQEEKVGMEDEALKKEKVVTEDEEMETEKAVTKDGTLGEAMTVYINEALKKEGDQSDVSLLQEIQQNDIAEKEDRKGEDCTEIKDILAGKEEKKGDIPVYEKEKDAGPLVLEEEGANRENEEKEGDSAEGPVTENSEESLVAAGRQKDGVPFGQKEKDAEPLVVPEKEGTSTENASTNFLKVSAQQDPSSPLAETKTVVYSEQNRTASTGETGPGCLKQVEGELDVKLSGHGLIFTEHLDSEQEGFLFAKGEPIFKEPIQSSESLPAAECSTLKKFKEQDVSSLSQFEATVIAASDLKLAPSVTMLDVACNGISSMPSPEATGFMEDAMVALAKDVLAAKCVPSENVQHKSVVRSAFSCPWKLSRRAFVLPSLVVPALVCLCFASAVNQDENRYLRPT